MPGGGRQAWACGCAPAEPIRMTSSRAPRCARRILCCKVIYAPAGRKKPHMINVLIIDDRALAGRPASTQCEAAGSRKPDLREKGHLRANARRKARSINWLAIDDVHACRLREHALFTTAAAGRALPRPAAAIHTIAEKDIYAAKSRRNIKQINMLSIDDVVARFGGCGRRALAHARHLNAGKTCSLNNRIEFFTSSAGMVPIS
jgi:hypothetical protein